MRPKKIIFFSILALVVIYSLYQARAIILGPSIGILSHADGDIVTNELVTLRGRAQNITLISLNGREIHIDEEGYWSEKLILATGTSIMTLRARDRFGRETEEKLHLILE